MKVHQLLDGAIRRPIFRPKQLYYYAAVCYLETVNGYYLSLAQEKYSHGAAYLSLQSTYVSCNKQLLHRAHRCDLMTELWLSKKDMFWVSHGPGFAPDLGLSRKLFIDASEGGFGS